MGSGQFHLFYDYSIDHSDWAKAAFKDASIAGSMRPCPMDEALAVTICCLRPFLGERVSEHVPAAQCIDRIYFICQRISLRLPSGSVGSRVCDQPTKRVSERAPLPSLSWCFTIYEQCPNGPVP